MLGFVRQRLPATGYGRWPLQTTALALELGGTRVMLCGVDIAGIGEPVVSRLVERVAEATGADPAGVMLNWNHTHLAPLGGYWGGDLWGVPDQERDERILAYAAVLQDKVVSVCRLAVEALEPARVVWGTGEADLAVNRRERAGETTILGWNPENLIDNQVTVLQARRPDESVIATVVSYGCHPVTTGYDMFVYSADYPGPMREVVRAVTGGECVFLQGSAGNVLPRVAFTHTEEEAERLGRRLAVEALHAVADRRSRPVRMVRTAEGSVTPISAYRRVELDGEPPALAAVRERVRFPLLPHPALESVIADRAQWEAKLGQAIEAGDVGAQKIAFYHASWARKTEAALRDGTAPTATEGWIHAIRIGSGVIATGPGETFTEIGMAVKERGPGRPTLYCGYTNGLASYFPTAAEYRFGGYEADYGCRSVGLPSHVAPECEQILTETAVRLAERLFPEATPWEGSRGWVASGSVPVLAPEPPLEHPAAASAQGDPR